MASREQRNRLADLLQQVVDGRTQPGVALKTAEAWTDMPWAEREINVAWHTLEHFQIDEDIRERDREYASNLRQELARHVAKLRSISPGEVSD
jgi:hypothetical protein